MANLYTYLSWNECRVLFLKSFIVLSNKLSHRAKCIFHVFNRSVIESHTVFNLKEIINLVQNYGTALRNTIDYTFPFWPSKCSMIVVGGGCHTKLLSSLVRSYSRNSSVHDSKLVIGSHESGDERFNQCTRYWTYESIKYYMYLASLDIILYYKFTMPSEIRFPIILSTSWSVRGRMISLFYLIVFVLLLFLRLK